MKPRPITDTDLAYWADQNPRPLTFTAPDEIEAGIEPCPGLITDGDEFGPVARVAWQLDEIDVAHLANGGTLWLSTWGGLPVHMIEVQPPVQR
jgi:hypothetical protein